MPDDYSADIQRVIDSEGYVYASWGGYGAHWGAEGSSTSLSGCGPEIVEQAIKAGAIVVDTSHMDYAANASAMIGAPLCEGKHWYGFTHGAYVSAIGRYTDPSWGVLTSVSCCDVRTYAAILAAVGAIVHNFTPTEADLAKGREYWSARAARFAAYEAEKEAKRAAENAALEG